MQSPEYYENKCAQLSNVEFTYFLMMEGFLKKESCCNYCMTPMKLVSYKKNKDALSWRCMNSPCLKYKEYASIRRNSFFESFSTPLSAIFKVVVKYAVRQSQHSIKDSIDLNDRTLERIIKKLLNCIPKTDFETCKLGGPGKIVQIDETMLNFKCKSHRGRSSSNSTDSLCIVEFSDRITRAFATCIPDKKASTIIPIICSQVAANSIIWTDEHRSYSNLSNYSYIHNTVCHKYEFVNSSSGVNTQAVESFHNSLKLEIKRKKGVLTNFREVFLKEFCFYFNNRHDYFHAVLF